MDLTAAVDAVKAHVAHETWCCAHRRGCPNPSQHVTLGDLDDGIIPEDVECPGECECLRSTTVAYIDEAVRAAAPLIEAAVRAKVAEEIEELEHTREEVADRVREGYSVDWSSGYDAAVREAARIVRGGEG